MRNAGTRSPDQPHAVIDNGYANGADRSAPRISMFWSVMVLRYADPATALRKVDNKHHDTGGDRGIAQKAHFSEISVSAKICRIAGPAGDP